MKDKLYIIYDGDWDNDHYYFTDPKSALAFFDKWIDGGRKYCTDYSDSNWKTATLPELFKIALTLNDGELRVKGRKGEAAIPVVVITATLNPKGIGYETDVR